MKLVVQKAIPPPDIDPEFHRLNGLQRASESLRYVLLRWEYWASPNGDMREWLRRNSYVGAWLLIPAICVMPVVGFILWQLMGWLSMLTSIAAKLIVLPILILVTFAVIKIVFALFRR